MRKVCQVPSPKRCCEDPEGVVRPTFLQALETKVGQEKLGSIRKLGSWYHLESCRSWVAV